MRRMTDKEKIEELERRISQRLQHSLDAEKVALEKLSEFPQTDEKLTSLDVLRRERLRHHTQSLVLKEIKDWIHELNAEKSL